MSLSLYLPPDADRCAALPWSCMNPPRKRSSGEEWQQDLYEEGTHFPVSSTALNKR